MNELPGYCFFKLRSRGRVFNVVHGNPEADNDQSSITEYMRPKAEILEEIAVIQPAKKEPVEPMEIIDLTQNPITPTNIDRMDQTIQEVIDANLKVQQFVDSLPAPSPPSSINTTDEKIPSQTSIDEVMGEAIDAERNLQEFFDSLSAATKHLDIPTEQQMVTTLSSTSTESTIGTEKEEKDKNDETIDAVIRMGKMPWEEEEEESANQLEKAMSNNPDNQINDPAESSLTQEEELDASLNVQRFFDSLSAATTYLDIPHEHPINNGISPSSTSSAQDEEKENVETVATGKKHKEIEDETLAGLLAKKPRF
jgi:hypothetical protein